MVHTIRRIYWRESGMKERWRYKLANTLYIKINSQTKHKFLKLDDIYFVDFSITLRAQMNGVERIIRMKCLPT